MDALFALALALESADYAQTSYIATHPREHSELNPIMGRHPDLGRVTRYFAAETAAMIVLHYELPPQWSRRYTYSVIAVESFVVGRNAHFGVKFSF